MSIFGKDFDDIVEADILELQAAATPEGLVLEYKRDAYGNSDSDKREFLKDFSSFANSSGGHLLIGMDESAGLPTGIVPLTGDGDAEVLRLGSLLASSLEPRVVGARIRWIGVAGGFVVLCRIPQSWNPPHRSTHSGVNRFFVRTSAGVHEASVEELRVLFSKAATARDRAVEFRAQRSTALKANAGIIPLTAGRGTLLVHLVPLAAFSSDVAVDLSVADRHRNLLFPPGAAQVATVRPGFDGLTALRPGPNIHGYAHLFRNGIIEGTKRNVMSEQSFVPAKTLAQDLIVALGRHMELLGTLDVPPPLLLFLSLLGVQGGILAMSQMDITFDSPEPIDRADLLFPPVEIVDYGTDEARRDSIETALTPLWNAAGYLTTGDFFDRVDARTGAWTGPAGT